MDRRGQKPTIERGGYTTIGTANTGENRPPTIVGQVLEHTGAADPGAAGGPTADKPRRACASVRHAAHPQ